MSIITKPFSWLLLMLYQPVENFGLAIILFALVVKLVMLPFQLKSKKSMMRMQSLNPILKELEKKHGGNPQKYQAEVAKLYQEEKINPMSGCLWTLIPFPILIALYSVVRSPMTHVMGMSEAEVAAVAEILGKHGISIADSHYAELEMAQYVGDYFAELSAEVPGILEMNFDFLGMNLCDFPQLNFFTKVNWADAASWAPALGLFLIPFISAFLSWLTMKVSGSQNAGNEQAAGMMKSMNLMMPLMSVYICFIMPAAMGIYWIANSVFAIVQELILNKRFNKIMEAENAERIARMEARAAELERKREEAARRKAEGNIIDNKNTSKRKIDAKARTAEAERRAAERAAERAAKGLPEDDKKPASQVGSRKYARGRAYDPNRYGKIEISDVDTIGEIGEDLTESVSAPEAPAAEE